jgi:predicted nucleotidyltransferase
MNANELSACNSIKERLSRTVSLIELSVFGSRARGDNAADSDMDLFIEVELVTSQIRRLIHDVTWEIGFDHDIVISPVIFSRQEVEDDPFKYSPFLRIVREEGIKI